MSGSRSNVDRSWMDLNDRFCKEYIDGVKSFLEVARMILNDSGKTRCPCIKCVNVKFLTLKGISEHLHVYGILRGYTRWTYHGENFKIDSTRSSVPLVNESLIENDDDDDDDDDGKMDMLNDMQRGAFHDYDTEKQHSYDPDTWVSKHAKQHHKEMFNYMTPAHVSETDVESNTMDSINSPLTDIDAMENVLGHRPGYRRGMGRGLKPPPKSGNSSRSCASSQVDIVQTQQLVEALNTIEELRARDLARDAEAKKIRADWE